MALTRDGAGTNGDPYFPPLQRRSSVAAIKNVGDDSGMALSDLAASEGGLHRQGRERRAYEYLYLPSPLLTKEGKDAVEIVNELVNTYKDDRWGGKVGSDGRGRRGR